MDLEDELDSQTDVHICINQPIVSDEKNSIDKTIHKTKIHKDLEKEEFKVLQLKDNVLLRGLPLWKSFLTLMMFLESQKWNQQE